MVRLFSIVIVVLLTFSLISWNNSATENNSNKAKAKDCGKVAWSHQDGANGPANWENLCDGFSACGDKKQSPINLSTKSIKKSSKLSAPKFSYGSSSVDIVNNGHTVQFNINGNNRVNLNGKEYKLLQFHYHAKSEHTINGKYYPLEVHFVHKHSDTDFAVIGVMFNEGKANKLLTRYLKHFPGKKEYYQAESSFDILSLLPANKSYYNYKGSLTTPPCSEVVNWYVLSTPITASKEQLKKFAHILHGNYRPVMPLNGRTVSAFVQ